MKRILLTIALCVPLLAQSDDYKKGLSALDSHDWDTAIAAFQEAASHDKTNAPAALYWKAYAQNKAGQREEALQTIAELRSGYKDSRWLNDARALEVEIERAL